MESYRQSLDARLTENGVTLPPFELDPGAWLGLPRIVAIAAINNTVPFSLTYPHDAVVESGVLCVAYPDNGKWVRYALWEHPLMRHLEVYTGERLGVGCRFEVWSVGADAPTLLSAYTMGIGRLNAQRWIAGIDGPSNTTLTLELPTCQPSSPCNPFCVV